MMALRTRHIDVAIQTLDNDIDPRRAVPGQLTSLVNGGFDRRGRITKRRGFDRLTTSGLSGTVRSVFVQSDQICAITTSGLYQYDSTLVKWFQRTGDAAVRLAGVEVEPVIGLINKQGGTTDIGAVVSWAYANGYGLICTETASGSSHVRRQVFFNTTTGRQLYDLEDTSSTGMRRAGRAGNTLLALGPPAATSLPYSAYLTGSLGSFSAPTTGTLTLTNSASVGVDGAWDVCSDDTHSGAWVAYRRTATDIGIARASAVPALSSQSTTTISLDITRLACYYHSGSDKLFVAYSDGSAVKWKAYSVAGNTWSAEQTVVPTGVPYTLGWVTESSSSVILATSTEITATSLYQTDARSFNTGTLALGTSWILSGQSLAAKPTTFGGSPALVTSRRDNTYPELSLVKLDSTITSNMVLLADVRNDTPQPTMAQANLCQIEAIGTTLALPLARTTSIILNGGVNSYTWSVELATVETTPTTPPVKAAFLGGTYLASGYVAHYDGTHFREAVPVSPPDINSNAVAVTGGFIDSTGGTLSLNYRTEYQYTDRQALIHRSAVSLPYAVSVASGASVNAVTLRPNDPPSWMYGYYSSNGQIVAWRTESLGEIYYYTGRAAFGSTLVDTTAVGDLIDNPILYDGTELPITTPPAPYSLAPVGGRLWIVPATRDELWPSKIPVDGYAPQWSAELVVELPGRSAPITAVADLDGTAIVLTEGEIFAVPGDGPDNLGAGGWGEARRLAVESSCDNPRSVISTPLGVMFQAADGFRLLDRTLSLARKGDGALWGTEMDTYATATVASVVHLPARHQVRWVLSDSSADMLVYDYKVGQWSTYNLSTVPGDSAVYQGRHVVVDASANQVMLEAEAGTYSDAGEYVEMSLEMVLSLAGIAGHQRVRRIWLVCGDQSAHGMEVKLYSDDATSPDQTTTWSEADIDLLSSPDLRVRVVKSRSNRLKVAIRDTAPAGSAGEGYYLTGLRVEVGVLPGARPQASGNRH